MIRMTRLHLINWHNFQDDIIDFKNITYLLGVNAVGKTTIMDAIRYCLTTNKDFNTAGNKKSGRTLLGSVHQKQRAEDSYLRPGHTVSYIGIEFLDENINKNFVITVRVESETPKQDLKGVYQDWYITKPGYSLEDIPFFTQVKGGRKPTSRDAFTEYRNSESQIVQAVIKDWCQCLEEYKKLPYDLKYDGKQASEIIRVLQAVSKLNSETYIRNFSTALFKDSKRFQKEFRSTVETILFDYTDEVVEKDDILGFYNLYENPTYVIVKGNVVIQLDTSVIDVSEMPDGIALSNASLEKIRAVTVKANKVITVENLTTYHDSDEDDAVHIYLGGYHNYSKQLLLEKIYADNKSRDYFHKGDLDVYGFLILENLKEKTGIPFRPLMMDVATIERFYKAGLYKELTVSDVKVIEEKKNTKLAAYVDVLQFMLDKNCKVEQESIKALELME